MKTMADLKTLLLSMDHRGYPAYKETKGCYQFNGFLLEIEHVQSDPFAPPSRLRLWIPKEQAAFPEECYHTFVKRIALQDYILRAFGRKLHSCSSHARGSGKSGQFSVSRCGQEVLERTACSVRPDGSIQIRMAAGFPARGRTILSGELVEMLFEMLPPCVEACRYANLDQKQLKEVLELAEDQEAVRQQLPALGLCAFIANGSILPRESGVSQLPLKSAVPFQSPPSLETALKLPHAGLIKGMGIRQGVTLVVGGGFHGKSTLLRALEAGVYNHKLGDGREFVITDASAVKIRAEDGRSIKNDDISVFIQNLPGGKNTSHFSTGDASGSTSQAANTVEAMEAESSLFLIDEDTCATNFMVRDALMQQVVHPEEEPIIPFLNRVHALYETQGISTVLVAGSSGLFFHPADIIIQMDHYIPKEITKAAKQAAQQFPILEASQKGFPLPSFRRCPKKNPVLKDSRMRVKGLGLDGVELEKERIDLRLVEQIVDGEQAAALGWMLKYAEQHLFDGKRTLQEIISFLMGLVSEGGLEKLSETGDIPSGLAMPRPQEVFACFNRYRGLGLE